MADVAEARPSAGGQAPRACGALGRYEPDTVRAIAAGFGGVLRTAHEDERSILLLDREPMRWKGGRERGLGWIEGDRPRAGRPRDWKEAATASRCGLALVGKRRWLHSSISGLAPIYWLDHEGATYFCSRLDPLARAAPGRLSVDWDAWASIVILRFALGARTPFVEIERLPPFATLRRGLGGARVVRPAWPWAELEPDLGLDDAADTWVDALRETLKPLGDELICPLSGGRDSRMLLSAARDRPGTLAITVPDDEGGRFEENIAGPVASMLDVRHEFVEPGLEGYPADWARRALAVDYQFVDHAWLVPLATRIEGSGRPVLDGLAIDTLFQAGMRFAIGDALDTTRPRVASGALFDSLRQFGHAQQALIEPFHGPLVARAREQWMNEMRRFEGHPAQTILGTLATRTMRGAASYPTGLLGGVAEVIVPASRDPVARAALSLDPTTKLGGTMFAAVAERLAPELIGVPSTNDTNREPPSRPRRWRSDEALDLYRRLLGTGPLGAHLSPELRAWLNAPSPGELNGHLRLGMEAIALFHAWCDRYGAQLGEVDAAALTEA